MDQAAVDAAIAQAMDPINAQVVLLQRQLQDAQAAAAQAAAAVVAGGQAAPLAIANPNIRAPGQIPGPLNYDYHDQDVEQTIENEDQENTFEPTEPGPMTPRRIRTHNVLTTGNDEREPNSDSNDSPQRATNPPRNGGTTPVVTRARRRVRPTQRWIESQEQQRSGLVSLYVSWEVFNYGGYQMQEEMDDPIAFAASSDPDIMYVDQALRGPDSERFAEAMVKEVTAHTENEHWLIVERSSVPKGVKVLPSVWAMRRKRRIATGEVYKWKARLNLHGGKQEKGVNYWETYAPVVSWTTIRLFLVLTLLNGYASRQIDFVLAYPQAEIEIPMYMELPHSFHYEGQRKTHCLLLQRNLYGQKQAGRVWNQYLHNGLLAREFIQSSVDMCLYYRGKVALLIYTNDGILIGPTPDDIDEVISFIRNPVYEGDKEIFRAFNITDEGSISDYLGVKVDHLPNGTIKLSQPSLTQSILKDLGYNERTTTKPTPAASTVQLHRDANGLPYNEKWHYRSVVGKLNFLEKSTRPDIAYSVHQCARFCLEPKESHATAIKRIGKYLLATQDKGIILSPQDHSFDCFVDADFVGNWNRNTAHIDPATAKSRSAWIIRYASCPIAWASKLQTDVALSSTEAEYTAMSESLRQVIHMMQLVEEAKVLGWDTFVGKPTVHCKVFEDNSGALEMARLPKMRPRTKHLCTRLHHFREHVRLGKISIQHIPTRSQLADIATKAQPEELFVYQRDLIMNWKAEHTAKEDLASITFNQLVACDNALNPEILKDPDGIVSWFQLDWKPLSAIDNGSYNNKFYSKLKARSAYLHDVTHSDLSLAKAKESTGDGTDRISSRKCSKTRIMSGNRSLNSNKIKTKSVTRKQGSKYNHNF